VILLSAVSGYEDRPFANLQPIVDLLLAGGNALEDDGFLLNPDGWRCRLVRPIDFELIQCNFHIPKNIHLSPEFDSVLDRGTWCSIEGPGAHVAGKG
jgi:hypothetical protein